MRACVRACVRVCVCVRAGTCGQALQVQDEVLEFHAFQLLRKGHQEGSAGVDVEVLEPITIVLRHIRVPYYTRHRLCRACMAELACMHAARPCVRMRASIDRLNACVCVRGPYASSTRARVQVYIE